MALMASQEFRVLGQPGEIISYSNEGYVLLAAIVERASGRPFPEYLQECILDPLGMSRAGPYTRETPPLEPEVIPFAVDTRSGTREVFPSPAWWDQGSMFGNGGLKSTTQDLLRYLEVYRTGGTSHGTRVVSAAGVAAMTTPHQPIPLGGGYGYGLRIKQVDGIGTTVEHGGNKGVATHVVVVPERGITAVALTNRDLRLEQGIRAFKEGGSSSEAAAIAGLPRAIFLQELIDQGVILLDDPSTLGPALAALGRSLGDERLTEAARFLSSNQS